MVRGEAGRHGGGVPRAPCPCGASFRHTPWVQQRTRHLTSGPSAGMADASVSSLNCQGCKGVGRQRGQVHSTTCGARIPTSSCLPPLPAQHLWQLAPLGTVAAQPQRPLGGSGAALGRPTARPPAHRQLQVLRQVGGCLVAGQQHGGAGGDATLEHSQLCLRGTGGCQGKKAFSGPRGESQRAARCTAACGAAACSGQAPARLLVQGWGSPWMTVRMSEASGSSSNSTDRSEHCTGQAVGAGALGAGGGRWAAAAAAAAGAQPRRAARLATPPNGLPGP